MTMNLSNAQSVLEAALGYVFPAVQIEARRRGEIIFSRSSGWLDPETKQRAVQPDTLFDLASVTKLFVVTAFMTLVEQNIISLDQAVSTVLPEFNGQRPIQPYEDPLQSGAFIDASNGLGGQVDAGQVTFRNLIVHNSGLPAWRPLYKQANPQASQQMALQTYFAYPIGARIVYSDIGLILLGMSIERLTGQSLDEVVYQRVTRPLGLVSTRYLPTAAQAAPQNIAPTEMCAWRKRRIVGQVHDENAYGLGGIAGHAGLFSSASELARFGQAFLDGGQPLLCPDTVVQMTRAQAHYETMQRGLGFVLWLPDPEASGNPFSQRAFGHTGFTGTSLWMDPDRQLVVACLTNRVYYGRERQGIMPFRVALHRAIVTAVDQQQ